MTSPDNRTPASDHLENARWHLQRTVDELKRAAQEQPGLLTKLGSRHAALCEELAQLERVAP